MALKLRLVVVNRPDRGNCALHFHQALRQALETKSNFIVALTQNH